MDWLGKYIKDNGSQKFSVLEKRASDTEKEKTRIIPMILDWKQNVGVNSKILISVDKHRNTIDVKCVCVCVF